jgi:hypothetical protein
MLVHPPHAHAPVLVLLALSPLLPYLLFEGFVVGQGSLGDAITLACFLSIFGFLAWRTLRHFRGNA